MWEAVSKINQVMRKDVNNHQEEEMAITGRLGNGEKRAELHHTTTHRQHKRRNESEMWRQHSQEQSPPVEAAHRQSTRLTTTENWNTNTPSQQHQHWHSSIIAPRHTQRMGPLIRPKELQRPIHAGGSKEAGVGTELNTGGHGCVVVEDSQLIPLLAQVDSAKTQRTHFLHSNSSSSMTGRWHGGVNVLKMVITARCSSASDISHHWSGQQSTLPLLHVFWWNEKLMRCIWTAFGSSV